MQTLLEEAYIDLKAACPDKGPHGCKDELQRLHDQSETQLRMHHRQIEEQLPGYHHHEIDDRIQTTADTLAHAVVVNQ